MDGTPESGSTNGANRQLTSRHAPLAPSRDVVPPISSGPLAPRTAGAVASVHRPALPSGDARMRSLLAALLLAAPLHAQPAAPPAYDLILRGGTVVNGTGAPRVRADVAIARHSPAASITVLWCSAMGLSHPSQ